MSTRPDARRFTSTYISGLKPGATKRDISDPTYSRDSRFVLPEASPKKPADPKLITRGVKRLLPRFRVHEIEPFRPHDLRRTGRITLGRLGVTPFIAERVINHSKDVLQEIYDLYDYFDERRDALERLENYLRSLSTSLSRT